jgi:hypothetical protein
MRRLFSVSLPVRDRSLKAIHLKIRVDYYKKVREGYPGIERGFPVILRYR